MRVMARILDFVGNLIQMRGCMDGVTPQTFKALRELAHAQRLGEPRDSVVEMRQSFVPLLSRGVEFLPCDKDLRASKKCIKPTSKGVDISGAGV